MQLGNWNICNIYHKGLISLIYYIQVLKGFGRGQKSSRKMCEKREEKIHRKDTKMTFNILTMLNLTHNFRNAN